jgi:hypothetical protein
MVALLVDYTILSMDDGWIDDGRNEAFGKNWPSWAWRPMAG